jgi:hypothetical protein
LGKVKGKSLITPNGMRGGVPTAHQDINNENGNKANGKSVVI